MNKEICLYWAAENGYVEMVRLLLDRGADVRARGDEALHWAASRGHVEVVELLKRYMNKEKSL